MFDKDYFENFSEVGVGEYLQQYPVGDVTVTVRVAPDHEFHLYRILKCDDGTVTFAYYEERKKKVVRKKRGGEDLEINAHPVITIRMDEIRWIEFNPGKISGAKGSAGFRYESLEKER